MKIASKASKPTKLLLITLAVGFIGYIAWYASSVRQQTNDLLRVSSSKQVQFKPIKVVAVGDIACDPDDIYRAGANPQYCQDKQTHALLADIKPDVVLALGDLQYIDGALQKFQISYGQSWGAEKAITYPVPGNHEYGTTDATGYFEYFKDRLKSNTKQGYYTVNVGKWQLIALNSNCQYVNGCGQGSEQLGWLHQTLQSDQKACTLAFWHHPHFTSGTYSEDESAQNLSRDFWQELVKFRADVILNGHDHLYERFGPQNSEGIASDNGPRQFTVGTGGKSLYKHKAQIANSQKIIDDQFGILILDLYGRAYKWKFQTISGAILDSGYQACSI